MWKRKFSNWHSNDEFILYIDNPFCVSPCNFCIYAGNEASVNSDSYKKYYNYYLPNQIEEFNDILTQKQVNCIQFGGGTPSLMTKDIMEKIFNMISGFNSISLKKFEVHPESLTKEKIDLLAEYKFDYISLGIQTLNKEICESQNRIYVEPNEIKELVVYAQEKGLNMNCDLLAFINTPTSDYFATLKTDLDIMFNYINPNIITISPMVQRFNDVFDYFNTQNRVTNKEIDEKIKLMHDLNKLVLDLVNHTDEYRLVDSSGFTKVDIEKTILNDILITKLNSQEFHDIKKYTYSAFPLNFKNKNVLSLGGYGIKVPYSYIGKNLYYYTINYDWEPWFSINDAENPSRTIKYIKEKVLE